MKNLRKNEPRDRTSGEEIEDAKECIPCSRLKGFGMMLQIPLQPDENNLGLLNLRICSEISQGWQIRTQKGPPERF
jgi:hypothetical protein